MSTLKLGSVYSPEEPDFPSEDEMLVMPAPEECDSHPPWSFVYSMKRNTCGIHVTGVQPPPRYGRRIPDSDDIWIDDGDEMRAFLADQGTSLEDVLAEIDDVVIPHMVCIRCGARPDDVINPCNDASCEFSALKFLCPECSKSNMPLDCHREP